MSDFYDNLYNKYQLILHENHQDIFSRIKKKLRKINTLA
jgi:hypothetical protein